MAINLFRIIFFPGNLFNRRGPQRMRREPQRDEEKTGSGHAMAWPYTYDGSL